MKKKIVFCMNCHASYIIKNIEHYNNKILNDYNIFHINYASGKYLIDNKLTDNDINLIKEADILICQYIKNYRGMLNHDYIKSIANTDKIYLIPHYTFSAYFNEEIVEYILKTSKNTEQIISNINNLNIDNDKIINTLNNELNHIKELDKNSSVCMFEFVNNNYKKYRLFQNRAHPNNLFFIEIANQLLKILGYNKLDGVYENFSNHSNQVSIIFPEVKNTLKLEFDCNIYSNNIFVSTIQYFQIINYKYCFKTEIVNKINNLTKNIDEKYYDKSYFFNFLNSELLYNILILISDKSN